MSENEEYRRPKGNKAFFGLLIIIVGVAILLRQLGVFPYLNFRATWPIILIVIGFFIGVQKRFTNNAWWILMVIGAANLIPFFTFRVGDKIVESDELVVPAFLIIGGIIMLLKPRKRALCNHRHHFTTLDTNIIDTDIVFGGRKEIITSKDFQGGSVSATFGGCELNMLQADSTAAVIELSIRATFGGVKIIVPAHWEIRNEIETTFGGVDDTRMIRLHEQSENRKTLLLKGSCVFGGVEIKSI